MAKKIMTTLLVLAAGFLLIQLVPYGRDHMNPAVVSEPKWDTPQTLELAKRACFDCHSNNTTWPWYSNIAPISWLIQKDVDEGRDVINFSEWNSAGAGQSNRRRNEAQAVRDVVLEGRMPPSQYLILHPNASLSQAEAKQLAQGLQDSLGVIPNLVSDKQ